MSSSRRSDENAVCLCGSRPVASCDQAMRRLAASTGSATAPSRVATASPASSRFGCVQCMMYSALHDFLGRATSAAPGPKLTSGRAKLHAENGPTVVSTSPGKRREFAGTPKLKNNNFRKQKKKKTNTKNKKRDTRFMSTARPAGWARRGGRPLPSRMHGRRQGGRWSASRGACPGEDLVSITWGPANGLSLAVQAQLDAVVNSAAQYINSFLA